MAKKGHGKPTTQKAASRIQSSSAKTGKNAGFAGRAQSAAAKNAGKSGGRGKK